MRGPYRALGQRSLASPGAPEQHGPQSRLRPVPSVGQLPGVSWGGGGSTEAEEEREVTRERERERDTRKGRQGDRKVRDSEGGRYAGRCKYGEMEEGTGG